MDILNRVPPKGMLVNLKTNERFRFQFNPETLQETIAAKFNRIDIPGLSYQRLQFTGTQNETIPIELFMSQLGQDGETLQAGTRPYIATDRKRFLQSLLYPAQSEDFGFQGSPRVLFIYPRTISLIGRVTRIQLTHRQSSANTLATTILVARLDFEEDADMSRTMEDVREYGAEHYRGGLPSDDAEQTEEGGA